MLDMLSCDFPGLSEEVTHKLVTEAQKYMVTHQAQGEAVYVSRKGVRFTGREAKVLGC